MAHGVFGVIGPQVYPVPGAIRPIKVVGRVSPVKGFCAWRGPVDVVGRYNTGGVPAHFGSKRLKENPEASPPPQSGRPQRYMRSPISSVRLRRTFQVSCTNQDQVAA